MGKFAVIDDLKELHNLIDGCHKGDEACLVRYGGPCEELANDPDVIRVYYGAPCNHFDSLKLEGDKIRLKYGVPCVPPYIITRYGGPCKKC